MPTRHSWSPLPTSLFSALHPYPHSCLVRAQPVAQLRSPLPLSLSPLFLSSSTRLLHLSPSSRGLGLGRLQNRRSGRTIVAKPSRRVHTFGGHLTKLFNFHASNLGLLSELFGCHVTAQTAKSLKNSIKLSKNSTTMQFEMNNGEPVHKRGALIVLEGLDRCGKTTQCSRLVSFLEGRGLSVESWRFPDRNTDIGRMISSYLANGSQLDDQTVHLLFCANRWEKRSLMENKLRNGTTLIVDRYSYSGVSFSAAKGLDIQWCKAPENGLIAPDLVVFLEISPEEASRRGDYGTERYERLEFQKNVAKHYQILQDSTWKFIDAGEPLESIEKQIQELAIETIESCRNTSLSTLWRTD